MYCGEESGLFRTSFADTAVDARATQVFYVHREGASVTALCVGRCNTLLIQQGMQKCLKVPVKSGDLLVGEFIISSIFMNKS